MSNVILILEVLGGALGFGVVGFLITCLFYFGVPYIEDRLAEHKVMREARLQARIQALEEGSHK